MLRPGGFPEYSPQQQNLFDQIKSIIEKNYASFGYQHIRTPAVEKTDVLKKGGEEAANQIFGLYGLAQGPEDAKDYALHFDLTVPFARYVLDRQNELAFPFKRYQIQPVRRGERTQKGRFKEFRQADIDAIRKAQDVISSESGANAKTESRNLNTFYDAEVIACLYKTLEGIFDLSGLESGFTIHINNKKFTLGLIKNLFEEYTKKENEEEFTNGMLKLFDKYHKIGLKNFVDEAKGLEINENGIRKLESFLNQDQTLSNMSSHFKDIPGLSEIKGAMNRLQALGVENIIFDPSIVRGLDYYTGTVFETFIEDRMDLGSICSGGAYANFTDFLDKKHSFSGVGGSIGLSRLFSILTEEFGITNSQLSTLNSQLLCVNFDGMEQQLFELGDKLRQTGRQVEIYPNPEKFAKQLQYADKKGITNVVIYGEEEKSKNIFTIKNLQSGETTSYKLEKSCGIIPVSKKGDVYTYLLIQHQKGAYRSFPKGHGEEGEQERQTAQREFKEETGIALDEKKIEKTQVFNEYIMFDGPERNVFKKVDFFIGYLDEPKEVSLQQGETIGYGRFTYEEAIKKITFNQAKKVLQQVNKFLTLPTDK